MSAPTNTAYEQTHDFASVNCIALHYLLQGDPANPTLVLVNMASHNLTTR